MTYDIGTKVDLTDLNDRPVRRVTAREHYETFMAGTRVAFLTMSSGIVLMSIIEASGQVRVSFGS